MTKTKQLAEFMENEIPSANIQLALKKFKDEIMELHNSGYAIHQIQRYLTNTIIPQNVKTTFSKILFS